MKLFKKTLALIIAILTIGACFAGCSSNISNEKTANIEEVEVGYSPILNKVEFSHKVTLNYNITGKSNTVYTVTHGKPAVKPANPTYNTNTFVNWYCKGEVYNWSTPITEDITINAVWKKNYSSTLTARTGSFTTSGTTMTSNGSALYVNENADFDAGTIKANITASTSADNGIVFCLTGNGSATYWEDLGVSYYFLFLARGGTISLGKVNNNGITPTWSGLGSYKISGYTDGQTYALKLVLSGTEARCYVNDKLYLVYSEHNFLQGKGFGIRAGASNIAFSDFTVSGDLLY